MSDGNLDVHGVLFGGGEIAMLRDARLQNDSVGEKHIDVHKCIGWTVRGSRQFSRFSVSTTQTYMVQALADGDRLDRGPPEARLDREVPRGHAGPRAVQTLPPSRMRLRKWGVYMCTT